VDEAWRAELAELIAIPSVSADPAHREDVRRAGEWVCEYIRGIGGTAELTPFGDSDLALGEIRASHEPEKAPTILCYAHFDVQPPAPLELWKTDPFELTVDDEWAYARGVCDDKGHLWMLMKAAQRLVEANALPVNLHFACDGEEEIGGHTIVDYLGANGSVADAAIILDGGMIERDRPDFGLATRGLIAFDVRVTTGDRDMHSGMFGGAALNAIHVLIRCFEAVLAGPDGKLPEPLRHGIAQPSAEELASWAELPTGASEIERQGARPMDAAAAEEFHTRTLASSSLDVNGIIGGKPGVRNTTLSVEAAGEFTIRLAPGQQVEVIGAAAEKLLRDAAPPGADLDIEWRGSPPGMVKPDEPAIQLGLDAFEQVWGVRPRLVRGGGTLPIMAALADNDTPTVLTGFGLAESDVHSPNEKYLVRYFDKGVDTIAALYTKLGELPKS
jgi:acetylornithine deacetylase/succinyl-diaminopimelate desuccinylase-like protein